MQTKYLLRAYGRDFNFDSAEAAERFLESNACAAERVDGEFVRELIAPPALIAILFPA